MAPVAEPKNQGGFTPWLLESSLAAAGVVAIALGGVATSVTELATVLFGVSLGGLVVLLLLEARARRRWMVR